MPVAAADATPSAPAARLAGYVRAHGWRYATGTVLLVNTQGVALLIPWAIKDTIEALGREGAGPDAATRGAALIVGLALLQGVARTLSRLTLLGAGQRVEADIRHDLYGKLLTRPPAFYQGQRTGDLMSRATHDLQSVAMLVGFGFLSVVNTVVVYVGVVSAMLTLDPLLTLVALLPYPLLVGAFKRFNARVHAESLAAQQQLARLSTRLQENLTGMAVVRAYTMEVREVQTFGALNAEYLRRAPIPPMTPISGEKTPWVRAWVATRRRYSAFRAPNAWTSRASMV